MMPHIFGNHKTVKVLLAMGLLIAFASSAWACPACAVSGPQRTFWQTFWALSFMGFLPIVLGVAVAYAIARIQKNEQNKITHL